MKLSFEIIMRRIEWITIPVGALALILSLLGITCSHLIAVAGILCGVYILYVGYLWIQRPKFDWHLIHGHFLLKVVAFVLLVPSLLTSGFLLYNKCFNKAYSSKNLLYEDYFEDCDTVTFKNENDKIGNISLETYNLEIIKDSLAISKIKLPETICSNQDDTSIFLALYYHFLDPGNQHMASKTGRVWAALIAILGVFLLNGLLVSSIVGWIDSRKEKWLKGEVKYSGFLRRKKHYVIMGGNDIVAGIVKQIISNKRYVLVQTSNDVESFRRELFSNLTEEQQKRVIIYYGNRTSEEDIKDLFIENAVEVYIIGEEIRTDDIESYHDTINMECLKLISNDIQNVEKYNKDNKLVCRVMFEYQTSFNILQVTDIDGKKIDFKPFNYYETWAQNVLVCQELENINRCEYLPLEGFDGIQAGQDKFVHLIVVGMSRMGLAMAIEAAHLAHYPNFSTNKRRTRITFIDTSMEQEKKFFMGRFKEMFSVTRYRDVTKATEGIYNDFETYSWNNPLTDKDSKSPYTGNYLGEDFIDIEWEFINGSIEDLNVQQYIVDAAACENAKLTISVCLPENSRAIAAAAYLPDSVYKSDSTLQVLVYQRMNNDLLIQINQNKRYHKKLKAFGMNSLCYNFDLVELSEFIASKVNAAYEQYAWEKMLMRYKGEGLIYDDYDSLSGYLYSNGNVSRDDKEFIKSECEKWMDCNSDEFCYQSVCNSLMPLRAGLKEYVSKHNYFLTEGEGKAKSAKMWSNQYNVYSMWTKFRCFGINPMKQQNFSSGITMSELGKMEHNRWVVEQLLLRYRPLKKNEQEMAQITDLYSSAKQKSVYKKEFAHLDICSYDKLAIVDYNVQELDKKLTEVLPEAYMAYLREKMKS